MGDTATSAMLPRKLHKNERQDGQIPLTLQLLHTLTTKQTTLARFGNAPEPINPRRYRPRPTFVIQQIEESIPEVCTP